MFIKTDQNFQEGGLAYVYIYIYIHTHTHIHICAVVQGSLGLKKNITASAACCFRLKEFRVSGLERRRGSWLRLQGFGFC